MNTRGRSLDVETVGQAVVPVAGSTVLLTAAFLGILALLTNRATGFADRFPYYVLLMAVGFVVALFLLERPTLEGTQILVATLGLTLTTFVVVTLAGEGITFAIKHPDEVLVSNLIMYLVSAALIASGLVFWSVRHWREYATYVR
ncbi:hypothetical protein [Halanaeroarchaeum sulfurireducens]|uniref:Uncharacterized protein n=1 Tax=Halanaeroarchaeum sulfurireducens TaxID=1604004 RepID=A0A0F7P8K2_9EURY|nr:hypothetical protein [Halanaeroarchaeum sulfurireducens]AKH97491.1 hypothetical protein HLASF_1002 [Halanaeroarchaeum sulfurireducens]ALG81887.1 hypothetical protein HLASA_0991 [Halanaeroarchaeum sulfurireducens]